MSAAAGRFLNFVLNQKGAPALYEDVLSNRPAAGYVGRLFVSVDTLVLQRDNGVSWDTIAGGGGGGITAGNDGLSLSGGTTVQLGQPVGAIGDPAKLLGNREIPLYGNQLFFTAGGGGAVPPYISVGNQAIIFQNNANDYWLVNNPIVNNAYTVPFVFSRSSTPQPGAPAPDEVVMWGHNLSAGGSNIIPGLPAIGYSLEASYYPDLVTRLEEAHMFYVNAAGTQYRLQSYTVTTTSDRVDFYHSCGSWSLKDVTTGYQYISFNFQALNQVGVMEIFGYATQHTFTPGAGGVFSVQPSPLATGTSFQITGYDRFQCKLLDANYNGGASPVVTVSGNIVWSADNTFVLGDYTNRCAQSYFFGLNANLGTFGDIVTFGRGHGNYPVEVYKTSNLQTTISICTTDAGQNPLASIRADGTILAGINTLTGVVTDKLQVGGTAVFDHAKGNSPTPTLTVLAGLGGAGAGVTINGHDMAGQLTLTVGAAPPAGGNLVKVTFAGIAFTNVAKVFLQPLNSTAFQRQATAGIFIGGVNATDFTITAISAGLIAGDVLIFNYYCVD